MEQADLNDGQISLSSLVVTEQSGRGAESPIEHAANVALSYRGMQASGTFFTSFSGLTAEVRTNFAHLGVQPFLSFISYKLIVI